MKNFEELGLSQALLKVLDEAGFKNPSEIQEKTISLALAGKDIIGSSATGSGKTLAFATPIIENLNPNRCVSALILTPTRELSEQVAETIKKFSKNKSLKVLAVYGGVDIQFQIRKIPETDVVVGTPGRILDLLQRGCLRLDNVKFLVLDEVDRMLDMGFYKDVDTIINHCPRERQTMMFSATISEKLDYLSRKYTNDAVSVSVESYVDHSKLNQIYYSVPDNNKFSLLVHLLSQRKEDLAMVFCGTKRNVDFITDNLQRLGINSKAIHGGIEQKKRLRVLKEFHDGEINILICTDVAARGLDIKDVSHIYNYDIPADKTDYIHRIGRTARAGKNGIAINIVASRDHEKFQNIMEEDSFKIAPEELPEFKRVFIQVESRDDRRRSFSRRNNNSYDRDRSNHSGNNRSRSSNNSYSNNRSRSGQRVTQRTNPRGNFRNRSSSRSWR